MEKRFRVGALLRFKIFSFMATIGLFGAGNYSAKGNVAVMLVGCACGYLGLLGMLDAHKEAALSGKSANREPEVRP